MFHNVLNPKGAFYRESEWLCNEFSQSGDEWEKNKSPLIQPDEMQKVANTHAGAIVGLCEWMRVRQYVCFISVNFCAVCFLCASVMGTVC